MRTFILVACSWSLLMSGVAQADLSQTLVEKSIVHHLKALPDDVFEAIFVEGSAKNRLEALAGFHITGAKDLEKSLKGPIEIFNPEKDKLQGDQTSSLLAIDKDLFIEGFFRNMFWRKNGFYKTDQPWMQWSDKTKTYDYQTSGAESRLLKYLVKFGRDYDAKTDRIRLYRGTNKREKNFWLDAKQKLAAGNSADVDASLKTDENGTFVSNDKATAAAFGGDPTTGAVVTIDISKSALEHLVEIGAVYVGYENMYFELSFLNHEALLEFAKSVQAD